MSAITQFLLGAKSDSKSGSLNWDDILSTIRDAAIVAGSAAAVQFLEAVNAIDFGLYESLVAGAVGFAIVAIRRLVKDYSGGDE